MPLIPNIAVFQRKLAGFPIATYQAGETVLTAASTSGRLLILRKGAVSVLKEGVEIATVGPGLHASGALSGGAGGVDGNAAALGAGFQAGCRRGPQCRRERGAAGAHLARSDREHVPACCLFHSGHTRAACLQCR